MLKPRCIIPAGSLRTKRFRVVSEQRKTEERRGTRFSVLAVGKMDKSQKMKEGEDLLLASFFARSLTLLPRSLLRNLSKTLATQANQQPRWERKITVSSCR